MVKTPRNNQENKPNKKQNPGKTALTSRTEMPLKNGKVSKKLLNNEKKSSSRSKDKKIQAQNTELSSSKLSNVSGNQLANRLDNSEKQRKKVQQLIYKDMQPFSFENSTSNKEMINHYHQLKDSEKENVKYFR